MPSKTLVRQKKVSSRRVVQTPREWRELARKALMAAEKAKDRRAQGIKTALQDGREKQVLKAMSIICENDIFREFTR